MLSRIIGIFSGRPQTLGQGLKRVVRTTSGGKDAVQISGGAGADRVYSNGLRISLKDKSVTGKSFQRSELSIGFENFNPLRSLCIVYDTYSKTNSLIRTVKGLLKEKRDGKSLCGELGCKQINTRYDGKELNKTALNYALSNIK